MDTKQNLKAFTFKTNPIEVAKSLRNLDYPANKRSIINCAKKNCAREEVMNVISKLSDKRYESPFEVSREIGDLSKYIFF